MVRFLLEKCIINCGFMENADTIADKYDVIVDVRDTLIQALGLVVCYRESLTALENVDVQRYVPFCVC